jgi:hypothetical protein
MSHLTTLLSLQGRSRRNARRQLALIRSERAEAAAAQQALLAHAVVQPDRAARREVGHGR